MENSSEKNFISFSEFFTALSSKKISRTKDGNLSLSGNIISNKDINTLYLHDISAMLTNLEKNLTPEFSPTKDLYQTLDTLSSPVLKYTKIPETVNNFYKKLNLALSSKPENIKILEQDITEYVNSAEDIPVFMLATMNKELFLEENSKTSIFNKLMPDSNTLMNGYGKKFNGEDILALANQGYIDAKLPINMLIYKSLEAQDQKAQNYIKPVSYKELLDFYSPEKNPERLHSLLKSGKIDRSFSTLHNELLQNVSKTEKKEYIEDIISETKKLATVSTDYSNDLIEYANTTIIPDSSLSGNISSEFLKNKYNAGELSLSRIIDIYKTDPKYFSSIETLLSPAEIEKAHENDELEDSTLMYLPEKSRALYLQKNNVKLSTIMYLFLHFDGISITELQKILTNSKKIETLDFYIDAGSHASRIKELYENYLIDYGCVKNLILTGILTEKDIHKYNFGISKQLVYDEIQNSQNINISDLKLNQASQLVSFSTTGSYAGIQNYTKDTEKKLTDVYKILGDFYEQNNINTPAITHKDINNKPSFLDGYKVLPLKLANLVAFIPPDQTKCTYLMPYQETAYILQNHIFPDFMAENSVIKEIKPQENMPEIILKIAYQFEEAKSYLEALGYTENLDFNELLKIITEQYLKIRIKGEN